MKFMKFRNLYKKSLSLHLTNINEVMDKFIDYKNHGMKIGKMIKDKSNF